MKRFTMSLAGLALILATSAMAQNPCNPCGGKAKKAMNPCGMKAEVAVNPCHAKMGTVFYVTDPMNRNVVTFESEAPLEDIVGTTNQLTGYVVFDPKNAKKGVHGEIAVPVASLGTGIPLRDEHLQSATWLNAAKHPVIRMRVTGATDIKTVKKDNDWTTYSMKVKGDFTLNGRTKKLEVPVTVTYLKENQKTQIRMPGDLLAGRAEFGVALADFGIEGKDAVVGSRVSEKIDVKISFTASSKNPEMAANPCGGKAKNPCGE